MNNKKIKVFLIAPLVLTAFLSTAYVSADETSSSVQEPTSSQVVSSDTEKTDVSVVTSSTETVTSTTSDTETAVSSEASSQDAQKDGETESSQSSVQTTQSSVASVTQLTPVTPNKSAQLPVADQVVRKGATAGDESSTESTAPVEATVVDNHLVINYKPTIAADEQVKFAVWSQVNGQDDLVWYDSSAAGAAYIDLSKHRSYGVYNVHTYAFKANQPARGISALTVTLPEPKVETEITQKDASTYAVTVKNVPSTIDAILIPVWSDKNGQDDIKWYTANHVSESTYTVNVPLSEHHNDKGHYDVHVYGHSQLTGGLVGLAVTKGFENKDTRENAKVAVVDYAENKTTFDVVVSSNANTKPIKAVSVAVWSEDKGQDDLKWYVPTVTNNQAKVTIDIANHSNTSDKYNVHVYTDYADGSRVGQVLGAYQITKEVEKPKVTPTLTDQGISIQLESKQVSDYTKVHFAVWSEDKGQDDLVWYTSDAKGHVFAPFSQHKGYGIYNIHTYVEDRGHMIGLNATAVDVPKPKEVEIKDPSVSVSRYDKDNGQLDVTVTQGDKEIKYVRVAAWSQDQQADIHWYVTKDLTNGKATITVDQAQHKDIVGKYTVHTYVDFADGTREGFVVGQYDLARKSEVAATVDYKGTGIYGLSIKGIEANANILYAVWSETKGQDDLKWYEASVAGNQAAGLINVENHQGLGTYNVHVYQRSNDKMTFLTATTFNVAQDNFTTPYYNQRDPRWANVNYGPYKLGPTGCVPTTLAMVFSSLKNTTVLPTTVADYLYNDTIEFNRGGEGTTGQGILKASEQWGLQTKVLHSQNEIVQALQEGHHVLAAIQHNKFVIHGTHELVLKGYSNGLTYVRDPYTASNSGWYPVSALWNEQSTDQGDTNGLGRPFVRITDV